MARVGTADADTIIARTGAIKIEPIRCGKRRYFCSPEALNRRAEAISSGKRTITNRRSRR